ncbi:PilZ domain-containing protein [Celerinatantimonas yamalensis]|uniref:PilZ domain-containing protein n=1 Tax=Celerinatantimonas yamalensis TaxID=559956 RepID=A0ABW9G893_9GAMM
MDQQREIELLNQLIPLHREADFNEIFQRMSEAEGKKSQFLLKMELKRLVTPSRRIIDLRDKVEGDCQPFAYKDMTHYLDEVGIKAFNKLIAFYGDYTQGVYEQMQHTENNLRELKNNPNTPKRAPKTATHIKAIQFGHYYDRVEERMFISLPIEIQTAQMMIYAGMSSNMSLSGLRIRYDRDEDPQIGEHLTIFFTGLEKEFANPILSRGTDYVIVDFHRDDKGLWVRLQRLNRDDQEFDTFFEKFLNAYKGRYRVDIIHLEDAIVTKSYQQFFLPNSHSLPLYFSGEHPPQLRYVLCNNNSQDILGYWYNEHRQNLLGQLFHNQRIAQLVQRPSGQTILYSFIHSYNRKLYFYSATHDELIAHPDLRRLFFQFGASKSSWRVFLFQWQRVHLENAFAPSIVPNQPLRADETLAREKLADLSYLGLLTDITQESSSKRYQQRFQSSLNPNRLQRFGQYRYPIPHVQVISHKYLQLRKEARYQYRSLAEVTINNQQLVGWVTDFSTGGMRIELDQPISLQFGETITINLPQFQKLVRTYRLSRLPYQVVNVQKNRQTLHLQAIDELHEGSRFFTQLIANNLDKLGEAPEVNVMEGLSEALRHLYCYDLFKHVLFVSRDGSRLKLEALAYGKSPSYLDPLLRLSRAQHQADLSQLIRPELWQDWLFTPLKAMDNPSDKLTLRLLMHINRNNKQVMACRREVDFDSIQAVDDFVSQAMDSGHFRYIELTASRASKPDLDYIKQEMNYVERYATHKVKELEALLWSNYAVVEINDLTYEWQALQYK